MWRNIGMADDITDRVSCLYCPGEFYQPVILHELERLVVTAFQLDADREIITAGALLPAGYTGVSGAQSTRDELNDFSITTNEKMTGDFQILQSLIIRMCLWIEPVGEKFDDTITTKFFRRQADGVNHQQADVVPVRPFVTIGRRYVASRDKAAFSID